MAVQRHKKHLSLALHEAHQLVRREQDIDVLDGLRRMYTRLNLAIDACDRKLWDAKEEVYQFDPEALQALVTSTEALRRTMESTAKLVLFIETRAQAAEQRQAQNEGEALQALFSAALGEVLPDLLRESLIEAGVKPNGAASAAEATAPHLLAKIVARFGEDAG